MEVYMGEENKEKGTGYSFMQEKVKQRPFYKNPKIQKGFAAVAGGVIFALAATLVWAVLIPHISRKAEEKELQPIELPEEAAPGEEDGTGEAEPPVYITETVSMELNDYHKMYQQLMQIGSQVEKSLVNISAVSTDTDWFDESLITQNSVCGTVVGDNGVELLLLTQYQEIRNAESLLVTFYDHTTAQGTLKKYDQNTGFAVVGVNLGDIGDSTRENMADADFGSSKSIRSGEPVLAVGSPLGSFGSILLGNITSANQNASLYDGSYNILTTDIASAEEGSGVLVNWDGKIVGIIQSECEVNAQKNTIQAYGISDMKTVIEHLSNNQDMVYMGIVGADVTTSISKSENIPIGVYVAEVSMNSPAIAAGIQPGDIITGMSGQNVTNMKDIMSVLLTCVSGQKVQVVLQRSSMNGYQELETTVELKILE